MIPNSSITRRRALKQLFAFSAALAAGPRMGSLLAVPASETDRHFLMIGDWAHPGHENSQHAVAAGMRAYAKTLSSRPEGVFFLGDNFYGRLPGGVHSPRWKTDFEDVYPAADFPGPCWAMAGNHDYTDDPDTAVKAELAYAQAHPGTRWTMPAKWYRLEWPKENPLVTCLVLDSNFPRRQKSLTPQEHQEQMGWLKQELSAPRQSPWLVCMGHHPLYTNGAHGDQKNIIAEWGPLFQEHKVDFYFCGHDHDLQHLEFAGLKTSFVVSGGGGARVRDLEKHRGPFSQATYGFTHLQVNPERFVVRHLDPNQKLLHAFSKTPAGQVTIL